MKFMIVCQNNIYLHGCPMNCVKKTLEKAGFELDEHIIVTPV
ncbi:putative zinc-binding protein [[Clostridium] fimetarium]|uniref:DGC domain-containing protein n=1 Tax=[Clostridium] fimetarium TaxID=99656 RepID=A0A1I0RU26_9FIRM|nr:DGC domain-containing protein [[Clostridium] fimetarium]